MSTARPMEVSQAERIVDGLLNIRPAKTCGSNFELDANDLIACENYRVDAPTQPQEGQLQKDPPISRLFA